jgi:hypothetical protein
MCWKQINVFVLLFLQDGQARRIDYALRVGHRLGSNQNSNAHFLEKWAFKL